MSVIHCPHCGTTNRAGSNFCNRCGAALRDEDRTNQHSEQHSAPATSAPDPSAPSPDAPSHLPADALPADVADRHERGEPRREPRREPLEEVTDEGEALAQPASPGTVPTRRLITGVQGLLDPLQIASELTDQVEGSAPASATAEPLAVNPEQLRRIRTLLADDPVLLDAPLALLSAAGRPSPVRLHLPWLMLLISLAIAVPILLDLFGPVGAPQAWPGVAEAHGLIAALPADATALLLWEYDPATAAEMDLVALPLVSHLLERRIQPIVVSQLPGGPAVAQRLFRRATDGLLADSTFRFTTDRELYIQAGYLPGGAALLSWVAQEPAMALVRHSPPAAALPLLVGATGRPAVTIVIAAQAEAVQYWVEQGQPLQYAPVLAFTSAGADPILRPYLASGQLSGLVSGFDGATTYQTLRTVPLAVAEEALLNRHLVLQNWGHFALLLLILIGNLAAWGGRPHG